MQRGGFPHHLRQRTVSVHAGGHHHGTVVHHHVGDPPQQAPQTPHGRPRHDRRLDMRPLHGRAAADRRQQLFQDEHLLAAGEQRKGGCHLPLHPASVQRHSVRAHLRLLRQHVQVDQRR